MYTNRLWGSRHAFAQSDVDFMTEPFADEERLRAGWATYQLAYGRTMADLPFMNAIDVRTWCSTDPTTTSWAKTSFLSANAHSPIALAPW
jgi:hypothetical protein